MKKMIKGTEHEARARRYQPDEVVELRRKQIEKAETFKGDAEECHFIVNQISSHLETLSVDEQDRLIEKVNKQHTKALLNIEEVRVWRDEWMKYR